jgi:prepilin-type N-terminal cleavage/methylation domain-containing protein
MRSRTRNSRGFSLVETIVAVAILAMVGAGVYAGFASIAKGAALAKAKNGALALANEQLEIVRGMRYGDVGIVSGIPAGTIPRTQTIERGIAYEVTTTVRSIDLEFDGTIGGSPNDTAPADQKLVEVSVSCGACGGEVVQLSTRVSPRSLEISSGNGAIFVQVVDATGAPVAEADVVVRDVRSAATAVEDVTGVDGWLRLVDVPPGTMAYEVSVGKDGYSSAKTYALGDPENPIPDVPHANVATGTVTEISFAIDRLAALDVSTVKTNCEPVGISFDLVGEKQIGLDTPKYDARYTTDSSGRLAELGLEWDDYRVAVTGGSRYLSGANPPLPLALLPGGAASLSLVTAIANPNALLVTVLDPAGLPIADAAVSVGGQTKQTGMGSLAQTDWSGGAGQEAAESGGASFWGGDGRIDHSGTPGALRLASVGGGFVTGGYLESSTFDTGTTTNFISLGWLPASQPAGVAARFQVATSASSSPLAWSFVGPDGTADTYYETPGQAIGSAHDGDRYIRYRAYLSSESAAQSPTVSDVWATYTLECAPAGQAYFSGLSGAAATVQVSKAGYQSADVQVPSWSGWSEAVVTLSPQ